MKTNRCALCNGRVENFPEYMAGLGVAMVCEACADTAPAPRPATKKAATTARND